MRYYVTTLLVISSFFLAFSTCNRKSNSAMDTPKLHKNCAMKHKAGPCRMAIKRYYYDEKEKKCKEFIYGGCEGAVPFETLEACKKGCGCE